MDAIFIIINIIISKFMIAFSIPRLLWLLLRNGARMSQKDKLGLTAVHIAASVGNPEALQVCHYYKYLQFHSLIFLCNLFF